MSRDIGGGDYRDAMTGVDLLVQQGIADPERLAVRGWSYGGILGGWTLTQTTRFKAASLGAMVTRLGVRVRHGLQLRRRPLVRRRNALGQSGRISSSTPRTRSSTR